MISAAPPCRTYIVYRHGLFAQGVRSILEERHTVKIVGMEGDAEKALKAVRALRPDVIIMEEPAGKGEQVCVGTFLKRATAGRVVTLSLDHDFATVYQQDRITATDPAELVKAVRGFGKKPSSRSDQHLEKSSKADTAESDRNGEQGLSAAKSRVRRARREETHATVRLSRSSREGRKGR